ncbi:MAG: biotin--[acetyl-CoA-carboxylase] ligase [Bryobacteraceae bacterium]|jgi:BirA family biotin operon repressor/biotin-[acetyl-CoA-carboxylase] ligase
MGFDLAWLRPQVPDRRIEWHTTIGSTMTEAIRLAEQSAPSGTVVGAEEQTAGQGRHGRVWHSEPGLGLYVSIILRRQLMPASLPVVTLALGLATRDAILKATDLVCDLRWPNDVLIESRKCAGILTVLEGSAIIAGIGINVNHSSFQAELNHIATSLRIASGRTQSRERLLVEVLAGVDAYCDLLESEGRGPVIETFARASSYVSGRRVSVDQDGSVLHGTTAGLDDSGFLILRGDDGGSSLIVAGGVRPCS